MCVPYILNQGYALGGDQCYIYYRIDSVVHV